MTLELQHVVRETATGRLGKVLARLPNEEYIVGFGRHESYDAQIKTLTQLRAGDAWDVLDWRELQGWGGGTHTDRLDQPIPRPVYKVKGHL